MSDVYTTEQLGPKQALTPEGYLLCEDVPIARTGRQIYAGFELPTLEDGRDGLIHVMREESEVFAPATIASFEGKSVTIGHTFVDPDNWKEITVGMIQNVRRGTSDQADLLMADLLITDARAIELVRAIDADGKPIPGAKPLREVSCGYDAEYEQAGPGLAYQRNIIGNHAALIPRGRAGPRCSIKDGEIPIMADAKKPVPLLQRLLTAVRSGDAALIARTRDEAETELRATEDEEAEAAAKAEKEKTADAIANLTKTVDALVSTVALLAKGKTKDEADPEKKEETADDEMTAEEKTKTGDAMRATVSGAEILVPGFQLPTTDSVANLAAVTVVRRKVLGEAVKTADGKALLAPLLGGKTADELTADAVDTVFVAASEMAKQRNNVKGLRSSVKTQDFGKKPATLAEMNARNAEFWKTNQA